MEFLIQKKNKLLDAKTVDQLEDALRYVETDLHTGSMEKVPVLEAMPLESFIIVVLGCRRSHRQASNDSGRY